MRAILLISFFVLAVNVFGQKGPNVLVFSKMAEFVHESTTVGIEMMKEEGPKRKFNFTFTDNTNHFKGDGLTQFDVVVFLNTTGDVLNDAEQNVFIKFIQSGGGYVGVHSASDTEYDWPWYGKLVGAYFKNHPHVQEAVINVEDTDHPSTKGFPEQWTRTGEWYNYREPVPDHISVLLKVDEDSYQGGTMNNDHPISWYHEYDGGRAFYTAIGHTLESFREPLFIEHLFGGIQWAAGKE